MRPLLECIIWSPYTKQDITLIEQVQRRFTKRLQCYSGFSYEKRLQLLNLQKLEIRRIWFDLILCYNIVFGMVRVIPDQFFQFRVSSTGATRSSSISAITPTGLDRNLH